MQVSNDRFLAPYFGRQITNFTNRDDYGILGKIVSFPRVI